MTVDYERTWWRDMSVDYEHTWWRHMSVDWAYLMTAHVCWLWAYLMTAHLTMSVPDDGTCLIYFICVCLRIVVSNTYCVVFLFCFFFVLCTLCCQFLWIVFFIAPSVFSNVYSRDASCELRYISTLLFHPAGCILLVNFYRCVLSTEIFMCRSTVPPNWYLTYVYWFILRSAYVYLAE
jgi:cell division protein FtsW (lipid II flippase)